jgi:hypothetical protein
MACIFSSGHRDASILVRSELYFSVMSMGSRHHLRFTYRARAWHVPSILLFLNHDD